MISRGMSLVGIDPSTRQAEFMDTAGLDLCSADYDVALGQHSERLRLRVPFEALSDIAAMLDRTPPDLIILHVGRCGSTLLARLLNELEEWRCLREPSVVNDFAKPYLSNHQHNLDRPWAELGRYLFRLMSPPSPKPLWSIKATSWLGTQASVLQDLVPPATRFVFLHRDPLAVVASQIHNPPHWATSLARHWTRGDFPTGATIAESLAMLWTQIVQGALTAAQRAPDRWMFIGYDSLTSDPVSLLGRLAYHGAPEPFSADTREALSRVIAVDSKKPALPFLRVDKAGQLSAGERLAVSRVTDRMRQELGRFAYD